MSAVAVITDNVIPVDFRSATPVVTDFSVAAAPKNDIAQRLAKEAAAQNGLLAESPDKKKGTLRILASGRSDVFQLNPYLITMEEGWNCRDYADPDNIAHIDSLARSIAAIGVQDPLTVRLADGKAVLTDGHCRWFAVIRAIEVYGVEIPSIPVLAESRLKDAADHLARQLLVGKQKSVIEQGRVFARLIHHGWTVQRIATSAGIGNARVSQILNFMADSNDAIKAMVVEGKIKTTEAEKVLRNSHGDADVAERTLVEAVALAESEGKVKATGRHVRAAAQEVKKAASKAEVRAIFAKKADTDGKNVNFTKAEWKLLMAF